MRVYHFLNRKYGINNIEYRRLKIARLHELNDPFELQALSFQSREGRQALISMKADLSRSFGILCFSTDWHNPVQWSHYAESHTGLCLGFDISDELLVHVQYSPKRLTPDEILLSTDSDAASMMMLSALSTKYSHWRYEKEVKVHVKLDEYDVDSGLYFKPFGKDMELREVIVGSEASVSRAELAAALGDQAQAVKVLKARLAFKSFRVVKQRQANLWE